MMNILIVCLGDCAQQCVCSESCDNLTENQYGAAYPESVLYATSTNLLVIQIWLEIYALMNGIQEVS